MMQIKVADAYSEGQVRDIVDTFNHAGITYWEKRNTIKVFEVGDSEWNVKSFQVPHLINRFAYKYIRKSKARRSYEHGKILLEKGILTPQPISYVEYSNLVGITHSFFISENLHYDFTFGDLIDQAFPDRVNALEQFAEFTYRLHENEIHHFDHSKGNTLMCQRSKGVYDFYLIDLNRMKFEKMTYEKRINNFNRLSLTPDMIAIIGNKYASLIEVPPAKVIEDIKTSCEKFSEFVRKKSRWKQRVGKRGPVS